MELVESHRLVRSRDGYVAGVAGGLARRLGVSSLWVRLAWLAAVLFFGTGILAYLVMWWVVPHEDRVPFEPTIWQRFDDGRRAPPWQRTSHDRHFLGVCGGLARRLGVDPSMVRFAAIGVAMASVGLALVAYFIMAIVMPGPDEGPQPVDL